MLDFFDCNVMIGRRVQRQPGEIYSVESLISEMDYHGIERALVYHALAKEHSVVEGNRLLLDEINTFPRLIPCWVLMPHHTGETSHPEEYIESMLNHDVHCARIFPLPAQDLAECILQQHRYAFIKPVLDELLQALGKRKIPLFLSMQSFEGYRLLGWEQLMLILDDYPSIPIIIEGIRQRDHRTLFPLIEKYKNLYFNISLYNAHRGIEEMVNRFGAERLLFGSGLPVFNVGGPLMGLIYAAIDQDAKQLIAGGNLDRLLKEVVRIND